MYALAGVHRPPAVLVLVASACSAPEPGVAVPSAASASGEPAPSAPPAPPPSASATAPVGGFALYPGATLICQQHVSGTTMHIQWWAYASPDPPELVARFHGVAVGGTKRGAREKDRLSVHAASDPSIPRCDAEPPGGTKTVVIVSTAT